MMKDYQELGLTQNEGKVYQILVEFGKLGAGEISGRSGVSYSKIYNVLNSLINKGLVDVVPERTKKFIPASPESLIKLIEQKEKNLALAKEKAREMKRLYEIKEKNPVIMNIGKAGFYKIIKELKQPGKYDYSIKWTSEFRTDSVLNVERMQKRKVDVKVLTRYDKETEKNIRKWLDVNPNMRKFQNEGVAMSISDDEEVMIALIKSNVTLLIKDKAFAKIVKNLFLNSYEKAEQIK